MLHDLCSWFESILQPSRAFFSPLPAATCLRDHECHCAPVMLYVRSYQYFLMLQSYTSSSVYGTAVHANHSSSSFLNAEKPQPAGLRRFSLLSANITIATTVTISDNLESDTCLEQLNRYVISLCSSNASSINNALQYWSQHPDNYLISMTS